MISIPILQTPHRVIDTNNTKMKFIVKTHTRRQKKQVCHVTTPDLSKEFKLAVDANGIGVGTVLPQDGNRSANFLLF